MKPSFAERRAESAAAVVGELSAIKTSANAADATLGTFRVHQVWKGGEALGDRDGVEAEIDATFHSGDTAVLLGDPNVPRPWEATPVDESSLAYFARLPDPSRPWDERLRYAAKHLEADDPEVADDAFRTFGPAPFDAVAAIAEPSLALPANDPPPFDFAKLRDWIVDLGVPDERKGFYGMLLGLATDDATRRENVALLHRLALAPASDFRAGFDGILGGLLYAEGNPALDLIEERFLRNAAAAEGDVRHAQTALRFYRQYGRNVDVDRLQKSLVLLLDRSSTAPGVIQDFTRAKQWGYLDRAERLFRDSPVDDPALDRAVVGYLLVCPKPEAAAILRTLRQASPRRVEEAEQFLSLSGLRGSS